MTFVTALIYCRPYVAARLLDQRDHHAIRGGVPGRHSVTKPPNFVTWQHRARKSRTMIWMRPHEQPSGHLTAALACPGCVTTAFGHRGGATARPTEVTNEYAE
jgi:hypothetical protein